MKKIIKIILTAMLIATVAPSPADGAVAKTFTGTVLKMEGSQIFFSTTSGAGFKVDIANAQLVRKNGSPMQFGEFLAGDKIEVIGNAWNDNSISATKIRDLTLYAHTGSFSGKITALDPINLSFTLQTSSPETKTIITNSLTAFKKNGSAVSFKDLELGMTAKVKGVWERKNSLVTASLVDAKLRLVNITVTGQLQMNGQDSITIISNNTIYGVDTTTAKILNKKGKPFPKEKLAWRDTIKITGKHVSGSVKIIGSTVKDMEREK